MVYVVEVESPEGDRATKEYETRTVRELARAIYRDLADYPRLRVKRAWSKEEPAVRVLP